MAGHNLPEIYQEVEYIQSSGTQYINTGYIPNGNSKVEFEYFDKGTMNGVWFGAYNNSSSREDRSFGLYQNHVAGQNQFYIHYSSNTQVGGPASLKTSAKIILDKGTLYIDGTLMYTNLVLSFTSPNTLYFLTGHGSSTQDQRMSAKIRYLKIYDNETKVRDMIPCYRKSDNVIGMYDLVTDTFYTNSGTGTFTKGADVTPPKKVIKKMYYMGKEYRIRTNSTPGWKPGSNTIAYYPLTSTTTTQDKSGHSYDLNNLNVQFTTYNGVDCGRFFGNNSSQGGLYRENSPTWSGSTYTFSCWFYRGGESVSGIPRLVGFKGRAFMMYNTAGRIGINNAESGTGTGDGVDWSKRNHALITYNNKTVTIYINGVARKTFTDGENIFDTTRYGINIGGNDSIPSSSSYDKWSGGISEVIYENKTRTEQEISNYYNSTKKNYGL